MENQGFSDDARALLSASHRALFDGNKAALLLSLATSTRESR